MVKFVNPVKAKKVTDPKSKSYETISSGCSDPLMLVDPTRVIKRSAEIKPGNRN